MHDRGAAGEGADEANHEIDCVIRRENAEVTDAGPERIERRERDALLEIIVVGEDAAFGASAGAGGIDDAGGVVALARHECWLACCAKIFPALRAGEIGAGWSFGDQHYAGGEISELFGLSDRAPQVVFDYEKFGAGMREELESAQRT